MSLTIRSGQLLVKDPDSIEFFTMDWDTEHLAADVEIASSSWIITGPDSILTQDNDRIVVGNRKTQVRLSAGTLGARYTVTNRIITNETPSQTKDASFRVLIQQD